jgi:trypsin
LIAPDIILTAQHCVGAIAAAEVGRYNISDSSEEYETFVFEKVVTHPLYLQQSTRDVDEYDYALLKIYDTSKLVSTFIELNTNPNLPETEGQEMHVMGWGKPTVNGTEVKSDVLQQAEVLFIPNEKCRKITSNSPMVNLSDDVFDITLCAADFKEGDDACYGDSGGPIILQGKNVSTDVQLGVTSYGFGCADPTLPGIYARVSYVKDWLADHICQLSLDPPSQYNCTTPVPKPDLSGEMINVTFQFSLDDVFPNETGWIVQGLVEDRLVTYHHVPIGSYKNATSPSTSIPLPNDRAYVFTIFDSFGDGNVAATVFVGDTPILVTPFLEEGYSVAYDFLLGELETSAPTLTPAPTTTVPPSAAPTMTPPFVTIVIIFDSYPEETGWFLEALFDSGEAEVLKQVYTYNDTTTSREIEEVYLLSTMPMTYRFTMTDNEQDGLCCASKVDGSYTLYLGSPEDKVVLGEGAEFVWEESHVFTVTANGTAENATTTTPPKSPTTASQPTAPQPAAASQPTARPPSAFAPIMAPTDTETPASSSAAMAAFSIGSALLCIMTMQILF